VQEKKMKRLVLVAAAALLVAMSQCAVSADPPNQPVKWTRMPDMNRGLDYSSEV